MADKRGQFRFLVPGSVVIQTIDARPRILKGKVMDVGRRGIGIHSETYVKSGTRVSFLMMNKDYDFKLKGTGRIANIQFIKGRKDVTYRIGLEFIEVDNALVESIVEHIKEMGW